MTREKLLRAAPGGPELISERLARAAKWLIGLRIVAVSALFLGALLVQIGTEEILPIAPLLRVTALTYLLSLMWIGLWLARIRPGLHGALQLAGDLVIVSTLIYLTGGPSSPFTFLFLIVVAVGAHMFGLRGALTVAGGAFVMFAGMAEALAFRVVPPSPFGPGLSTVSPPALGFQLFVTGAGFATVAFLTSYLAHTVQRTEIQLLQARATGARFLALSADVLRSVDSGVLAVDLGGQVVLANPAARRILTTGDPLEGQPLDALLAFEGIHWSDVLAQVSSVGPVRLEGTERASGIPLGLTVTPLRTEPGAPVGFVVHFRDVSEVKETARRESLRERMAAVGEMAAGIAHEIRNPLASISGSAQVLGKVPGLGPTERRLSHIIVEESRRLSGIIESFLEYARPPEPHRGPCDIGSILEDTLTLFAHSQEVLASHRISSEIEHLPHPVEADEKQLRQAFFNLARNAIQAMPQGGTMTVVGRHDGSDYVVEWRDEGVGMEEQQIKEIFQPFRAFRKGGTGLGLAVVYSIVTDHGGDIQVASALGRGTTFTLRFPVETQ
jgi:two-component system, NtrC family, sensor histidine kinase PilS